MAVAAENVHRRLYPSVRKTVNVLTNCDELRHLLREEKRVKLALWVKIVNKVDPTILFPARLFMASEPGLFFTQTDYFYLFFRDAQ